MKRFLFFVLIIFHLLCSGAFAEVLSYIPKEPQSALIMMHGFGGNGARMNFMTNHLKESLPHTAFYYPTAPDKAPTGGYQWFVIPMLGEEIKDKTTYDKMMKDALRNVSVIHELIDDIHQNLNIPYQNIHVAGFSQGGLMALLSALTNKNQIGKAVSFSGVPLLLTPDFSVSSVNHRSDILLMQGDVDRAIPKNSLDLSTQTLKTIQISPLVYSITGLTHSINNQEIEYMIDFLKD